MPEPKRNILNFENGISYKHEGMPLHSFHRFHVVKRIILPTVEDIKISPITFDMECSYLHIKLG